MDLMSFLSKRFETQLVGDMKFGDEVLDEHGDKAVVVKGPYPVGRDRERFVTVYSGYYLSSAPVKKFQKTGKSYAKELNTIFNGLRGDYDEQDSDN